MGMSFYWGDEAALYHGARNFARLLSASPGSYGLTAEQASAYAAVVATWSSAYLAASDPSQRTKGCVSAKNDAKRLVRRATADLAKVIAGTATVSDQQKIDLGLSVRSTSRTAGPPGTPGEFRVELSTIGAITIKWKCANPTAGTMYEVYRAIGGDVEPTFLATVGAKRYTDFTVPIGSSRVTYRVRAVRSTAKGAWANYHVNFGLDASTIALVNAATTTTTAPARTAA